MRVSKSFTKTLKNAPADEVAKNAQLLIRAGFVHKEMAGVYSYLPYGWRVIEKIKHIVRQEMDAAGANELLMSTLQPSDIWEKTNRWNDAVVDNWFKTKLLNGTELGVGLTHEEPIVDAARAYLSSYKDLPMSVYQIGSKFRNEKRAKSGILRGREFLMKDLYTFARDQKQHEEIYEHIAAAYTKVYARLGIGDITHRVKADGGIFTPRFSDEYQTISAIGEDTIYHVPGTDIYFNQEVAPSYAPLLPQPEEQSDMVSYHSPGIVGVAQLAEELAIPVERTVKTMIYLVDERPVAVALRGDYEVNEIKLRMALSAKTVELADAATVTQVTSAEVGYAGLIGLTPGVDLIADDSIEQLVNFECGANKTDYHNVNVNWDRDLERPAKFYDIKDAKKGDLDPTTKQPYEVLRSVEVGNIFPLETKYTDALDMYYADENGQRQSFVMGCYGIGISRLMGVIAEHFSDEKGLVWPEAVAPYQVYLVSIGTEGAKKADEFYETLQAHKVEVLYDDRDERAGTKFADSELLGIPHRITISDRSVVEGEYELTDRKSSETKKLTLEQIIATLNTVVDK